MIVCTFACWFGCFVCRLICCLLWFGWIGGFVLCCFEAYLRCCDVFNSVVVTSFFLVLFFISVDLLL